MIEIEVQIVYGSWIPSETFIEKFERVANKAHSHENFGALADFSTDENGNLTYKGQKIGRATLKSKYYANDWDSGVIGFDLTGADTFFGFFEPLPDNAFVYDFSVEFNGKTYMSSELYSESLISNTSTLNVFGKPEFNSDYGIYLAARTGNDSEGTLYCDISADMGTVTGFTLYYLEV